MLEQHGNIPSELLSKMTFHKTSGKSTKGVYLDEAKYFIIGQKGVSDTRNQKCKICGLKQIDHNREMNRACDEQYRILYDNFQMTGGRWEKDAQ